MIPVEQRGDDDCFAACIASLLEAPIESVPNVGRCNPQRQLVLMQSWLRYRGLTYVEFDLRHQRPRTGAKLLGVLSAEVPGCDYLHAVVAEYRDGRSRVIHDPAGSCRLGKRVLFGWLTPIHAPAPRASR